MYCAEKSKTGVLEDYRGPSPLKRWCKNRYWQYSEGSEDKNPHLPCDFGRVESNRPLIAVVHLHHLPYASLCVRHTHPQSPSNTQTHKHTNTHYRFQACSLNRPVALSVYVCGYKQVSGHFPHLLAHGPHPHPSPATTPTPHPYPSRTTTPTPHSYPSPATTPIPLTCKLSTHIFSSS